LWATKQNALHIFGLFDATQAPSACAKEEKKNYRLPNAPLVIGKFLFTASWF
jgi:hypothetical protein